jgi:hypothetical protein
LRTEDLVRAFMFANVPPTVFCTFVFCRREFLVAQHSRHILLIRPNVPRYPFRCFADFRSCSAIQGTVRKSLLLFGRISRSLSRRTVSFFFRVFRVKWSVSLYALSGLDGPCHSTR